MKQEHETTRHVLIETCLETGHLTEAEIAEALEGTKERKELRAVMSLVECFIAEAHAEATLRGVDKQVRDEACGGARFLKELREELIELTRERKVGEEERKREG